MDRFELTIALDNEAMQTGGDVADVLRKVADNIDTRRGGEENDDRRGIRDENGNAVGSYVFS